MTRRHRSAQQLSADALIDLYQIDTSKYGGGISCWTPGPMGEAAGNLIWNPRCRSNVTGWNLSHAATAFAPNASAFPADPQWRLAEGSAWALWSGGIPANEGRSIDWTQQVSINPGQVIQAQARLHPRGCKAAVRIDWWNGGSYLSSTLSDWVGDLGGSAAASNLNHFALAWVNGVAPSGATLARLAIHLAPNVDGSASAGATGIFFTRALLVASAQAPAQALEFAPGARVGSVSFASQVYTPLPIRFEGLQRSGRGPVPRVTLVIPDIESFGTALMVARGNLLGCPITRIQAFRHALDDGESPDPSDFFGPERFFVDRVARWVPGVEIALECASPLDVQGTMLPARQVIADVCSATYRHWNGSEFVYGTCPYADSAYFDAANVSVVSAGQDVCSQSLKGCRARYGASTPLPFDGFPGVSRARY